MANTILGEKREGSGSLRSRQGMPVLEESYIFTVRSDSKNNSRLDIITTPGLPVVGLTVSAFGFSVCVGKEASRRSENPLIWDVTCTFSSEVDEKQNNQDPKTDPVAWIPIYETKFERLQELVTKDFSGTAIANSAGQPFQTGLTIGRFIPIWEFYQFEPATVTDETIIDRNETTNSAIFKGRAIKSLLLTILESSVGFYYGSRRRLTKYSLKYNSRLWTHKRLDVGTVYKSGSNHLAYTDNNGNVILGGLDGSTGAKVAVGDPPGVRSFDQYNPIAFASFLRI